MRTNIVRNWLGILALLFAGSAMSQVLTYTQTDLVNGGSGDAWQYSYTFNGMLQDGGGLTLYYSPLAYANINIASVAPIGTEFQAPAGVFQAGGGGDGLITLITTSAKDPNFITHFVVTFDKVGVLGDSHPFEVFDSSFNITNSGTATLAAAVPEPSSAIMLTCGLLLLGTLYRRRLRPGVPAMHGT